MIAQQLNIDNIANNLANVNTTGYKKSRIDFQDLLYQTTRAAGTPVIQGAQVPTGIQIGHGVRPVSTQKIFTQGEFKPTDGPLDILIEGEGFFQVLLPDGSVAYTRDGAFKRDGEGKVVNSDGFLLLRSWKSQRTLPISPSAQMATSPLESKAATHLRVLGRSNW